MTDYLMNILQYINWYLLILFNENMKIYSIIFGKWITISVLTLHSIMEWNIYCNVWWNMYTTLFIAGNGGIFSRVYGTIFIAVCCGIFIT
eukprot:378246_1